MKFLLHARQMSTVTSHPLQSIHKLTLNRPKALNALNKEMVQSLHQQIQVLVSTHHQQLQYSRICKSIVLTNEPGSRAFCAGGDVKCMLSFILKKLS